MKIGIPKALLYYRYGKLWETFLTELGMDVIISGDTNFETLQNGTKSALDENCLPLKIFMAQVESLILSSDYIFVPRFVKTGHNDEYCVRFWGLPDLVRNSFPEASLTGYNISSIRRGAEAREFIKLGLRLGHNPYASLRAYNEGLAVQCAFDKKKAGEQEKKLYSRGTKILVVAQPYVIHDAYLGGAIRRIIESAGGVAIFSDRFDRSRTREASKKLSRDIYWTINKEMMGAVSLSKEDVSGVILLTAFPCGADSLANELIFRRAVDIPLIQIILDENTAEAGLETRIESFMDILRMRRDYAK